MLEAPDLGNEDAGMPKEQSPGKPTTRRYSSEEKAAAVRMVRTLREELGTEQGTVARVAELRRANEILKSASAFFAAELDRPAAK
ncbi:hypothetical protein BOH72_01725 [Mycobacterium sp. WY10]|nr:hypothetical protein BOH72_01725 [Mycobacterium sp. WY10]